MAKTSCSSEIISKRLFDFAKKFQDLTKLSPKTVHNQIYCRQGIRSSSSPGANYIEAVEASSRKDFIYRLTVCRKELKESVYWAKLIKVSNSNTNKIVKLCDELINEGNELVRIFSSSVTTAKRNIEMKDDKR